MKRVSFIGVGNMGGHMATNLVKAGYSVTVFDANMEIAKSVSKRTGGLIANSISEAADCDFCITMLPTSDVVQEVLTRSENGGFLNNVKSGTIVIDMSSSEPLKTQETGKILAEKGVVFIDAPVSGGMARAETGSLAIMIGCDNPDAIEKAKPVLSSIGSKLFCVGGLGAGDVMKAANNFVAAASYTATAEALGMGKIFGLDPSLMVEILNESTGRSFNSEVVFKDHVVTGRYSSGFALGLLTKDVGIAASMVAESNVDFPVAKLVSERYKLAQDKVGYASDNSEAIRAWYENF